MLYLITQIEVELVDEDVVVTDNDIQIDLDYWTNRQVEIADRLNHEETMNELYDLVNDDINEDLMLEMVEWEPVKEVA